MATTVQIVDHTKVLVTIACKDSTEAEKVAAELVRYDVDNGKFRSQDDKPHEAAPEGRPARRRPQA